MNQQSYRLESLPGKVVNFIRKRDRVTQERINGAFEYIVRSPFQHENSTIIKRLRGAKRESYRYRIGDIRFIYRVDRENRTIRIIQIDNRGDIY